MNLWWWKSQMSLYFLQACWKQKTLPWNYYFLNLEHLDQQSGLYSKYVLNEKIPKRWQLKTILITEKTDLETDLVKIKANFKYPIFLKPEWSQSSLGVYRVTNPRTLKKVLKKIKQQSMPYLCQAAAKGKNEYDLMSITRDNSPNNPALFSCTRCVTPSVTGDGQSSIAQLINTQLPSLNKRVVWLSASPASEVPRKGQNLTVSFINGTNNGTQYQDQTPQLNSLQQQQVYQHIKSIGKFSMTRISVAADSLEAIVAGNFEVIEINLLSPFPLNFLDPSLTPERCKAEMKEFTFALAASMKAKRTRTKRAFFKLLRLQWVTYRHLQMSRTS